MDKQLHTYWGALCLALLLGAGGAFRCEAQFITEQFDAPDGNGFIKISTWGDRGCSTHSARNVRVQNQSSDAEAEDVTYAYLEGSPTTVFSYGSCASPDTQAFITHTDFGYWSLTTGQTLAISNGWFHKQIVVSGTQGSLTYVTEDPPSPDVHSFGTPVNFTNLTGIDTWFDITATGVAATNTLTNALVRLAPGEWTSIDMEFGEQFDLLITHDQLGVEGFQTITDYSSRSDTTGSGSPANWEFSSNELDLAPATPTLNTGIVDRANTGADATAALILLDANQQGRHQEMRVLMSEIDARDNARFSELIRKNADVAAMLQGGFQSLQATNSPGSLTNVGTNVLGSGTNFLGVGAVGVLTNALNINITLTNTNTAPQFSIPLTNISTVLQDEGLPDEFVIDFGDPAIGVVVTSVRTVMHALVGLAFLYLMFLGVRYGFGQ